MVRFIILLLLFPIFAAAQVPNIVYEEIYTGFTKPVDITAANDGADRLFIVEKDGFIKIIENGSVINTPFLDIDGRVNSVANERGLLGLVFHPDYENNGYFFVNYTNSNGTSVVSRFEVSATDPNIADDTSEEIIITINQNATNHNAGDLNFSPIDGYLYIAMGDGGSGGDPLCTSHINCFIVLMQVVV